MFEANEKIIAVLAASVMLALPSFLNGQDVRWTIDPKASSASWEVTPKWNALRATTCPEDPSWTPGEGTDHARASEWEKMLRAQGRKLACTEAVTGDLFAGDTIGWRKVRGVVALRADQLVTGLSMRDRYARDVVLETRRYPEIRFAIDSLVAIQAGDTLLARAAGVFELRGVRQPMTVPIVAWHERGVLRVKGAFEIPARDLTERYGASPMALGLAIKQGVWKALVVGIDLTLIRETPGVTASR